MREEERSKGIRQFLFLSYLKLLRRTVRIEWTECQFQGGGQIFGFWHEDSFLMNLVLAELSDRTSPIDVIVTADTRGSYITRMLEECGGNALRVPDGFAALACLKKIMQRCYEQERSIAVALDGPRGPRHKPKKLAFYLAEQEEESFVGITASYSVCIRLFWRWDRYALPLPFSRVTVALHDYGTVHKNEIPKLPLRAGKKECGILLKDM